MVIRSLFSHSNKKVENTIDCEITSWSLINNLWIAFREWRGWKWEEDWRKKIIEMNLKASIVIINMMTNINGKIQFGNCWKNNNRWFGLHECNWIEIRWWCHQWNSSWYYAMLVPNSSQYYNWDQSESWWLCYQWNSSGSNYWHEVWFCNFVWGKNFQNDWWIILIWCNVVLRYKYCRQTTLIKSLI